MEYDNKDFYQFMWHYERMVKQRNKENEGDGNSMDNPNVINKLDEWTRGR